MLQANPAKLLRIHITESDHYQGKPLYEAIVDKCREMKIAGATVFRGLEGYGEIAEIHKAHVVHHDRPIVISIVDKPDSLSAPQGRRSPVGEGPTHAVVGRTW
jgi:uncharacterized protein